MKKFVRKIFLFIPFSLAVYLLMLFLWGNFSPGWLKSNLNYKLGSYGHSYTRLKEVKEVKDVDLLVLGSSHAYRGFDPRIFAKQNLNVFNLGSSAQTPIQTKLLLNRYLDQLNPGLVLYEVYPGTFSIDGVESALDLFANDKNDRYSIQMAMEINHVKIYNTLIFAFMRDVLHLNSSYMEPVNKDSDTYVQGGYVERDLKHYGYFKHLDNKWTFDVSQMRAFGQIIALLNDRGIKVVLIYAPVTGSLYNSYDDRDHFDSLMNVKAEYYNFNELMNLDDSLYFYDSHHLNQNGVEEFNEKLIDKLFNASTLNLP